MIDPPITQTYSKQIQFSAIHQKLFDLGLLPADLQINQTDNWYKLPTKAQWDEIASKCPVRYRTYSKGKEAFDCDEFAKAMIGWIALKCGNVAAGFVASRHYQGTTLQGGHALVAVMDYDQNIWIIEPQNGKLYSTKDAAKLGGYLLADRIELARVYF